VQWEGEARGRYPNHLIGKGTLLVADNVATANTQRGFDVIREGKPLWAVDVPQIVRAMVLSPAADAGEPGVLFIAGPLENPEKTDDKLAPYRGLTPGRLWAVSTKDGGKLAEWTLPATPVFDGLAAAGGRLYASLSDGALLCLAPAQP
jgi:hypothetical protein